MHSHHDRGFDGDNGYHGPGARFLNPSYNRWGRRGYDYQHMNGYHAVDYSNGWNTNMHDQMLQQRIQNIFLRHDRNRSGQLEGP